jgi:hypothetical protein
MNTRLIGPLCGVLFVLLVVAAFIVSGETPDANDSVRSVVSFYVDNDSSQMFSAGLLALGCVALLFFLATLRRGMRAVTGDEGGLSTATLLGGVMIVVGASIFAGIGFTLGDTADDIPPSATMALNALNSDMFFPIAVGTAVFNLGLGLSILRHGGFPRPLGWVAVVLGIAGLTPAGFFAFLGTAITIIWTSIVLAGQASQAGGTGAPPPAAPPPPAATAP